MDASHPIESELNFSLDFFGKFKKEITTTTTAATVTTATTATRKWMLQCHKSWRAFWPIWCRGRNDVIGSLFPQQGHAILLYAAFPYSPGGNTPPSSPATRTATAAAAAPATTAAAAVAAAAVVQAGLHLFGAV